VEERCLAYIRVERSVNHSLSAKLLVMKVTH